MPEKGYKKESDNLELLKYKVEELEKCADNAIPRKEFDLKMDYLKDKVNGLQKILYVVGGTILLAFLQKVIAFFLNLPK